MKIHQLLETPIDMTGDPNDPTVYGHERANPMSLKGRIVQARNQLKELAELAESDDLVAWEKITRLAKGGMFMGLEQNLEQIRHGIEQLAAKRRKGGVQSRGIDKNIGEQGVAEGSTDDDTAKTAYMYGLRHGREGVGNNMDRAKAEWGNDFKHYNAGFLKGRNQTAKSLKAVGLGYGSRQQGVAKGKETQ